MNDGKDLNIDRISAEKAYVDRSIYRNNISIKDKYSYRLKYKYTDLFITSDRDIVSELEHPVLSFYTEIEKVIESDPVFGSSLVPVKVQNRYSPIIKKMCHAAKIFGVGPMAAVAGAVCDRIAEDIAAECGFLMIENGGDIFIKSADGVKAGLYSSSEYFSDRLNIIIDAENIPCGICSSSGKMGHSMSTGNSDLVTIMSDSATMADAAATAIANSIRKKADIERAMSRFKNKKEIKGMVIIKGDRIGICGAIQLASDKK